MVLNVFDIFVIIKNLSKIDRFELKIRYFKNRFAKKKRRFRKNQFYYIRRYRRYSFLSNSNSKNNKHQKKNLYIIKIINSFLILLNVIEQSILNILNKFFIKRFIFKIY